MRTIFSWLILTALLLSLAGASLAQDAPDCPIDVQAAVALMFEAQRAADRGDAQAAQTALAQAQSLLADLETACAQGSAFELPQVFYYLNTAFSLRYPAGWQTFRRDDNFYFGAPDIDLAEIARNPLAVQPGQVVLALAVVPESNTVAEGLSTLQGFVRPGDPFFSSVTDRGTDTIAGFPAGRLRIEGSQVAAEVVVIDLMDERGFDVLAILALSVRDEIEQAAALLNAVAATIQSGFDQAALDTAPAPTALDLPGIGYDDVAFTRALNPYNLVRSADVRALSPDGTGFAYVERDALCVRLGSFQGTATCTEPAEPGIRLGGSPLHWSPDGRYIAFTNDFYRLLFEPDVIVFDTVSRTFTNLTQDNVDRFEFSPQDPNMLLDIAVTWAHDSRSLILYRVTLVGERDTAHGLYRLPVDGGEPELLLDLTPALSAGVGVISYILPTSLDGRMVLSPDGARVAFLVATPGSPQDDGVWVADLTEGRVRQALSLFAINAALPEANRSQRLIPQGVSWTPDGRALYVHSVGVDAAAWAASLHHFDLETGALVSMVNPVAAPIDLPQAAAPTPDRDGVVFMGTDPDRVRVVKTRVVGGAVESEVVYEAARSDVLPSGLLTVMDGVGANGAVMLSGVVFQP